MIHYYTHYLSRCRVELLTFDTCFPTMQAAEKPSEDRLLPIHVTETANEKLWFKFSVTIFYIQIALIIDRYKHIEIIYMAMTFKTLHIS